MIRQQEAGISKTLDFWWVLLCNQLVGVGGGVPEVEQGKELQELREWPLYWKDHLYEQGTCPGPGRLGVEMMDRNQRPRASAEGQSDQSCMWPPWKFYIQKITTKHFAYIICFGFHFCGSDRQVCYWTSLGSAHLCTTKPIYRYQVAGRCRGRWGWVQGLLQVQGEKRQHKLKGPRLPSF